VHANGLIISKMYPQLIESGASERVNLLGVCEECMVENAKIALLPAKPASNNANKQIRKYC
jgi:hypothetical protein